MKKYLKTIFVLIWFLGCLQYLFANYDVTFVIHHNDTINSPVKNEDGTWKGYDNKTHEERALELKDGNDPNEYTKYGCSIPTEPKSWDEKITVHVESDFEPQPSENELNLIIETTIDGLPGEYEYSSTKDLCNKLLISSLLSTSDKISIIEK